VSRRLLILSCSKRKCSRIEPLPATHRYDGPAFRVLRSFQQHHHEAARHLDVYVLSARYGLIPSSYSIPDYDFPMTAHRALELHDDVRTRFTRILSADHCHVCLALSNLYLLALGSWEDLVPSLSTVVVAGGGLGARLARLKQWLTGKTTENPDSYRNAPVTTGHVRFRGVKLCLTPDELATQVQHLLAGHSNDFRLRDWYVDVNGVHLPPKWLLSKLTGVAVSRFSARDARRVFQRLGILTHRVQGVPHEV
jgi:hypothetical protein